MSNYQSTYTGSQIDSAVTTIINNDESTAGKSLVSDGNGGVDFEAVLPAVTASDAGKFLRVNSSGAWVAETVQSAQGGSF